MLFYFVCLWLVPSVLNVECVVGLSILDVPVGFLLTFICPMSCAPNGWRCFWIVHSRLTFRFSLTCIYRPNKRDGRDYYYWWVYKPSINRNQNHLSVYYTHGNQKGSSWSWSCGSYIYNYLYSPRVSHLSWDLESRSWRCVLNTALCDDVYQLLAAGRWYSPGIPVSPRVGMLYLPLKEHVAFCAVIKDEDNICALSKNKIYLCEVLKQVHVE